MTPWVIRRNVDLAQTQQRVEYLGALMYTGDACGHEICVEVTLAGEPVDFVGNAVRAYVIRPDGRTVMINGTPSANVAKVVMSAECYACSGQINVVVRAEKVGSNVALYAASATVRMSTTDAIVDPGNTIPSLSDLLAQIDAMTAGTRAANTAASAATTAATNADAITRNATAAENARVSAENARKTAETARADAETKRASAESARVTAESGRASAEGTRASAENARKTAETARADAETKRASAESARVTAESGRASAEDTRASAENARKTAETARATAETVRAQAEAARVAAETKRETDSTQALQDARNATAAADGWARATATAQTLAVGAQATANVTTASDGHKVLALGLPTGATGATGAQGRSLRPQGAWAASKTYTYNTQYADVVTHDGSSYMCIASNTSSTSNAPPNATYWQLMAAKGNVDNLPYATTAPKAAGTASAGTAANVSRGDHVHPAQTSVTGNAGTATKLATARKVGNASFDGSVDISLAQIGAAAASHGTHVTYATAAPKAAGTAAAGTAATVSRGDHVHPVQTSVSGNAGTATKLATARKVGNASFDGSEDISLAQIGAAAASHGTHVTYATAAPKAAGAAAAGTAATVSRGDHVHPVQTSVSGNAGTATRLATARKIGNASFDGSADISLAQINAMSADAARQISFSLPLSSWSGSGPYTAVVSNATVTAKTLVTTMQCDAATDRNRPNAWLTITTSAGTITISSALKPLGALMGYITAIETK